MTLWLAWLLGPPMAAPETAWLRIMRWTLIMTASALAALLLAFDEAVRALGSAAPVAAAAMMLVLAVLAPIWLRAKRRADDDHFARLIERARR